MKSHLKSKHWKMCTYTIGISSCEQEEYTCILNYHLKNLIWKKTPPESSSVSQQSACHSLWQRVKKATNIDIHNCQFNLIDDDAWVFQKR